MKSIGLIKVMRLLITLVVVLVALLITGQSMAQSSAWSLVVDTGPGTVDLAVQLELTVTASFSATSPANDVLVICAVQSGQINALSPGLYPLGDHIAIWTGDLLAEETSAFTLTIRPGTWPETHVPCAIIEAGVTQQAVTGTLAVTPFQSYVPSVLNNYAQPLPEPTGVHTWTYPAQNWLINSSGANYAEAAAGTHLTTWRYDRYAVLVNQPPTPTGGAYNISRDHLYFDVSAMPAGQIISAWLELHVFNTWSNAGGYDLVFQRGTWSVPPTTPDWTAYGEILGVYDTDQYTPTASVITIPLSGLIGQARPPEVKLTLRGDEFTEFPVGALNWRMVHIALQWPWSDPPDQPVSRLHLIIAEPTP